MIEGILPNLDLLSVGLVIAATVILGFLALFANPKGATSRSFFVFAIITALWSAANFASYRFDEPEQILWIIRAVLFLAILHATSFFALAYVFPDEDKKLPKWFYLGLLPWALVVAVLTQTPLIYQEITAIAPVIQTVVGPAIALFGLTAIGYNLFGIYILGRKAFLKKREDRKQIQTVFWGMLLTFVLVLFFNFALPSFANDATYIPFGALFMFPFVIAVAYATLKQELFNAKVVTIGALTFLLASVTITEVIFAESLSLLIFNGSEFILVLIFGVWLIRSVTREVRQRERIEKLAEELKVANERLKELDRQKSEFVSIASHQLRSPITAIRGYVSLILEKEFGDYPATLKEPLSRIYESVRLMIKSIEDYLNISRIEQGRMKYEMSDFDISELTKTVVDEYVPVAQQKSLQLSFSGSDKVGVHADIGKIKQVIANLVDNSIKYTPTGSVTVKATVFEGKARVTVSDTGVGIPKDDLGDLFNKFVRARGANKINTSGTGLGLYVAKQMVEAHKGKIWAESEGKGKGSRFVVELPTKA